MISLDVEAAMRGALARLQGDAERAEKAAPGTVGVWWAGVIGADPSASAAKELARHARADADRFAARLDTLLRNPSATDADGLRYVNDAARSYAGGAAGAIVQETSDLLTPVAAVAETAKGTAKDLASALPVVGVGAGVVILAVLLLSARDALRDARS